MEGNSVTRREELTLLKDGTINPHWVLELFAHSWTTGWSWDGEPPPDVGHYAMKSRQAELEQKGVPRRTVWQCRYCGEPRFYPPEGLDANGMVVTGETYCRLRPKPDIRDLCPFLLSATRQARTTLNY